MKTRLLSAPGALALLMVLGAMPGTPARAQDADPPGRVARLSDVEGSVSLQPAGMQDWTAATLNRPVTTADRLWVDQSSRAELDIGDAAVRLGSATGFSFLNLDDVSAQMQLTAGTLIVRVRDMQASQTYEVDTPNLAVSLLQPGEYRVEVSDAGDATVVKVSEGAAQALAGAQAVAIGAQQSVTFTGTQPTLAYYSATPGGPDDLDSWSTAREQQVEDSVSSQYVADDIPGTQDLDNNGRWQETPDYGYVWMPTAVVVGWVPYRFGHWVWITPWGWNWVDDARWGYAPFHYGRWVQWHNTWCWVPGPRFARAAYAPALVAWVGGSAPGTPLAFGSRIGWFPLGPREVYVPAVRVSPTYLRNVNMTNTTIVNNTYVTQVHQSPGTPLHYVNNRPAAVTTVSQNIFVSGQPVGRRELQLPPAVLAGAVVSATAPAITPIRQSVLGPGDGRGVAHPPAALLHRPVQARTAPPRAPASLEQQVAAMRANGGRPLARAQLAQLEPVSPATPVRVTAPKGPVIAATALPHRSDTARVGNRSAPGGLRPTTETSSAPAWRSNRPATAPQRVPETQQRALTAEDATPAYSGPPSLPVYLPPVGTDPGTPAQESPVAQERQRAARDRVPQQPAAAHASAPAAGAPPAAHGAVAAAPAPPAGAQVTAPAAAAPPAVHPAPPAQAQATRGPRDSAAHGDRDSRARAER